MILIAWSLLDLPIRRFRSGARNALFGLVMAISTVASMTLDYEVTPSDHFDFGGPLIAVAGLFGGIPATIVTVGSALGYRIYMGGPIGIEIVLIIISGLIGLAAYALRRKRPVHFLDILLLATTEALLLVFTLPQEFVTGIGLSAFERLAISFLATIAFGAVIIRDQQQQALKRENTLYRSMVDNFLECLYIKDKDGHFLAANPATAAIMRAKDVVDLIGKSDFDFYPEQLARRFREDELAVLQAGAPATIEQPGQQSDGSPGWLSTLKVPVADESGRIVALVTHSRDITASKSLQAKLDQTQSYLDEALENMKDGLAVYDAEGVLLFCNPVYRDLFPKTRDLRVPGERYDDILRAGIACGETVPPDGMTPDAYVAVKLSELRSDGERPVTLGNGRTYASQTRVLCRGWSLRTMSDITERLNFERDLQHRALHDPLTNLPNRAYFNQELERRLADAKEHDGELVVMLLDLDHFKEVNDTYGHAAGDALLIEVSRRLEAALRRNDFVARLGGDEFAVLFSGLADGVGDVGMVTRIMKGLMQPLPMGNTTLLPRGTIGYTIFPSDNSDADGLMKNADRVLYDAKAMGRGIWKKFDLDGNPPLKAANS